MNNIIVFPGRKKPRTVSQIILNAIALDVSYERIIRTEIDIALQTIIVKMALIVIGYAFFVGLTINGVRLYSLGGSIASILGSMIILLFGLVAVDTWNMTQIRKRTTKLL